MKPFLSVLFGLCLVCTVRAQQPMGGEKAAQTRVLEAAGLVEVRGAGTTNWLAATNGLVLFPGDHLRTGAQSRSAVQFSDRSVLRLSERTDLRILPPSTEGRRFRLMQGRIFFFNRERPASVEFETPLATGAIRGTEFVLEAQEGTGATRLALLDGLVDLTSAGSTLSLQTGEAAHVEPGQPPQRTALLNAVRSVQWALYYPAVVVPSDLALSDEEKRRFTESLALYQAGDLLKAQAALPPAASETTGAVLYRATLDLAVGDVDAAWRRLALAPATAPVAKALREMLQAAQGTAPSPTTETEAKNRTASEWLAHSYACQAVFHLPEALTAAQEAAALAPGFGPAHSRVAELEWAFERRKEANLALDRALAESPRLAPAHALRGFMALDGGQAQRALEDFDRALALDAALGQAWLGRGLTLMRLGRRHEALASLQAAAALEPRRALFRSYLGKAWSQTAEPSLADKEFRLARSLDAQDPTAWFYQALHEWQQNRPNAAVRDLEKSTELNDQRQLFRSRLALERDLAMRSANLAAIYRDAGLAEVGQLSATRAVGEDYANYSSHLYLQNSYRALAEASRYDLRYETAQHSEGLMASLLAPAGSAPLSLLMTPQEHLQYFELAPFGLSSFTEYRSTGDWRQEASAHGSAEGLSYALDVAYQRQRDTGFNDHAENHAVTFYLKQRVTAQDEWYAQVGTRASDAGDVARYADPSQANPTLQVQEKQVPNLYLGWHRAWTPEQHTLLLVSRLEDSLELDNRQQQILFLRQTGGQITDVSTSEPGFGLAYQSGLTLYSGELQHFWQQERHTLIMGGRMQAASVEARAELDRQLTGVVSVQEENESLWRGNVYGYWHWQVATPLRLVTGVSYDYLAYPVNTEVPPITSGDASRRLLSPKVGLEYAPWRDGLVRAGFTRSLGGVYFDQSVRLEPTTIAGFNQAFRSLLPESVSGQVPGTDFTTYHVALDQTIQQRWYVGVAGDQLESAGERLVGALTNAGLAPVPELSTSTPETLKYRERRLSAYAVQLVGDGLSLGARYRLSHVSLDTMLTELQNLGRIPFAEQHESGWWHEVGLSLGYQHPRGFFTRWESDWHRQAGAEATVGGFAEDFWQHNLWAGWRFPGRRVELGAGVLNLTDQDYRLNPLHAYGDLPRHRTAVFQMRLEF